MPGDGEEVYWSSRARRFYQTGRRGAVGREQAASFLEYDPEADRWRDTKGRFVPTDQLLPPQVRVRRFVTSDEFGRPFITAEFTDRLSTREQVVQTTLEGNQQVMVRTVIVTPDGKTHVSYTASKLGGKPNVGNLEELASRKARAELVEKGYDITTGQVNASTKARSYSTRTVTTRS